MFATGTFEGAELEAASVLRSGGQVHLRAANGAPRLFDNRLWERSTISRYDVRHDGRSLSVRSKSHNYAAALPYFHVVVVH
jgi:hypothetical protein